MAETADPNIPALRALLNQAETSIDLAKAKLTIDHIIDPAADIDHSLQQINGIVSTIHIGLPLGANSWQTMLGLRSYLYQSGPWNGYQPYQYDLTDPYGQNIHNKLLSTYLVSRKGNCVSMPFLYIILGQRLGIDVSAATAPNHALAVYKDDQGKRYNMEATSGGNPVSDAEYQKSFPMTAAALRNGVYLRPLSKHETVGLMMDTLLEYYGEQGWQQRRIALADMLLHYFPKDVNAMLANGNSYYQLLKINYLSKYPTPNDIPMDMRQDFKIYYTRTRLWFQKAEALGWRQPDKASEKKYSNTVSHALLRIGQRKLK